MSWFRYARWEDVPSWEALGWALHRDLGVPHNHHAVLMIWVGEGEPPRNWHEDVIDGWETADASRHLVEARS